MADEPQDTGGQHPPQSNPPLSEQPQSNGPQSHPPQSHQPQDIHYRPTQAWQSPPQPQGVQPPPPPPSAYPQQPGPYGYPPQGVQPPWGGPPPHPGPQPPGYGYPPQPGYPVVPVGAPSRGGNGGVIAGVIGGVVALALIVGAVLFFAVGGNEDDRKPAADAEQLAAGRFAFGPDRSVLWRAKSASTASTESTALVGQWVGDRNLVVGDQKSLISYDLKTGSQGWTMQPPEPGASPCTMSGTVTKDGVGAVLFRKGGASTIAPCTLLAAVDTTTGSVKWSADLAPDAERGEVSSVAVDDKSGAVYAIAGNRAASYRVEDGKQRWMAGGAEACSLTGLAAPTAIFVAQACYDDNTSKVATLSRKTGKPLWRYTVPGTASSRVTVLSAAPAVALINPGSAAARGHITAFDGKGRPGEGIAQSQPYGKLPDGGPFDAYPKYSFRGTTMVVSVSKSASSKATTVAAFDLTRGREKWHRTNQSADKAVQVVGFDGANALAVEEGSYSTRGQLIRFPLGSGTPATGGRFPTDAVSSLDYNRVIVRGGLILALENYASTYNPRVTAFGPAR